jgi:hypothetical protein
MRRRKRRKTLRRRRRCSWPRRPPRPRMPASAAPSRRCLSPAAAVERRRGWCWWCRYCRVTCLDDALAELPHRPPPYHYRPPGAPCSVKVEKQNAACPLWSSIMVIAVSILRTGKSWAGYCPYCLAYRSLDLPVLNHHLGEYQKQYFYRKAFPPTIPGCSNLRRASRPPRPAQDHSCADNTMVQYYSRGSVFSLRGPPFVFAGTAETGRNEEDEFGKQGGGNLRFPLSKFHSLRLLFSCSILGLPEIASVFLAAGSK